jgi:hypothetical protein
MVETTGRPDKQGRTSSLRLREMPMDCAILKATIKSIQMSRRMSYRDAEFVFAPSDGLPFLYFELAAKIGGIGSTLLRPAMQSARLCDGNVTLNSQRTGTP